MAFGVPVSLQSGPELGLSCCLATRQGCRKAVNPGNAQPALRRRAQVKQAAAQGQVFEQKQQVLTVRSQSAPKGNPQNAERAPRGLGSAPACRLHLAFLSPGWPCDEIGKPQCDGRGAADVFQQRRQLPLHQKGRGFPDFGVCCFSSRSSAVSGG